MALPQTFGTDHVFGLLDITQDFITIQSDGIDSTCGVDVKVLDALGRVCTVRKDDQHDALTFMGILKPAGTKPQVGHSVTFDSVKYIVDSISNTGENTGFRKYTVKATKYQQVVIA
jgi:hypothetical protein